MGVVLIKTMAASLDAFCGKYYFNNDHSMNFVAAERFNSTDEQTKMLRLFHDIDDPKARHDLFVHDTLYNIEITPDQGDGRMVMNCWTGDMQLTVNGEISRNQAKGKTVITLDKSTGLASMDIGGGR